MRKYGRSYIYYPRSARSWLKDSAPRYKMVPEDAESKRRRRSTANRVLTILKAALNYAFDAGHAKSNTAWGRRLKPFRQVDAARQRFLSVNEARRLVNASGQDFRKLVQAALVTGAAIANSPG